MVVTDAQAPPHGRTSTFLVPAQTPGLHILRNTRLADEKLGTHGYLQFDRVFVPDDHLLGEVGGGFLVAQTRLGGGRIHHAMRTIGLARRAFEMMCERAMSRFTQDEPLARKQMVQEKIADSWLQLEQFRLLVLQTAWRIDKFKDYKVVLKDISAVKALMPKVLHDIAERALQIHGSLGVSTEMPFTDMLVHSYHMGLADGPTEVHKVMVAKQVLRGVTPAPDLFPSGHLPRVQQAAREKYAALLAE
jgi:acyl-CoA dehydrogenase